MAMKLPREILARIAAETLDTDQVPFESWLCFRHVCRTFKIEIEKASVQRYLAHIHVIYEWSENYPWPEYDRPGGRRDYVFIFKGLDALEPWTANFELSSPDMEQGLAEAGNFWGRVSWTPLEALAMELTEDRSALGNAT